MAVEEDDGARSPAALVCEACTLRCKDLADLSVHQERHRPVDPPTIDRETGKETSFRCPEGCGRNFTALTRYRDHVPACDGSPPLEPFMKNIPTGFRTGFVICPECLTPFRTPEDLSYHLERHREVRPEVRHRKTGLVVSKGCPKKCGRHFTHWKEFEEHKRLCDGKAPLPPNRAAAVLADKHHNGNGFRRKGKVRQMYRCDVCERDFRKAGPFAMHMKRKHQRAYQPPASDAPEEPAGATSEEFDFHESASANGGTVSQLWDKSRTLRREAVRLDEIANKIERLWKEADELM